MSMLCFVSICIEKKQLTCEVIAAVFRNRLLIALCTNELISFSELSLPLYIKLLRALVSKFPRFFWTQVFGTDCRKELYFMTFLAKPQPAFSSQPKSDFHI
ncbi:hypothetical protein M514_18464 [Trichuris suis]|uniref:Uncharacterized protein n=1 Tax=Trichuris suis TaxID=68888 RepID=A0A085NIL9_9BILA|nr:hypothetical protein M514_18464 [Trichuris suis]